MPSRLYVSGRLGRHALVALFILGAITLLSRPPSTGAVQSSPVVWEPQGVEAAQQSLLSTLAFAPPVWSPNVPSNTDGSGNGQHEPSLAVSLTDPNVVVVANKDYREGNIKRVWIEVSRDGGLTWPTQLHMPGLPSTVNESDPVVIARDDGRIYVLCLTTGNEGVFITWSDDNGVTWRPSVPIVQNQPTLQDKPWFAIDNNPASPYYHRMYLSWAPGANGVVTTYSTDGGLTWSPRIPIPSSGPGVLEYSYPVVSPNGDVFVFHMADWYARWPDSGTLKVVKSTDGGASWGQPVTVATIYQPPSPPRSGDDWRFFSIISAAADPTNNNRLYTAWTDHRNYNTNGMEVFYSASTDHGATWGPATRLSHDPTGVVRDHITPMLDVDETGRLHALWLDRRLDPTNRLFQAWYSSSTDGGATWEPDSQVSDAPGLGFDFNIGLPPGSGNAAGDYWGLDAAGGYVYAAWTDTRNGNQDIYTSRGTRPGGGASPTATVVPSATGTSTGVPTGIATATSTIVPSTSTRVASVTSTSTSTPCAVAFSDVQPSDYFYEPVRYLFCRQIISGYSDNTFRPYNNVTRAQAAKMLVLGEGWPIDVTGGPHFLDVPPDNWAYPYVETAYNRPPQGSIISGYDDGTFRPGNDITRGQLAKIAVLAEGWEINTTGGPHFNDVAPDNAFYAFIETAYNRGIITGYADRTFRWGNPVTRGQTAKILYNALTSP